MRYLVLVHTRRPVQKLCEKVRSSGDPLGDPQGILGGSCHETGDPGHFDHIKIGGSSETTSPLYNINTGRCGKSCPPALRRVRRTQGSRILPWSPLQSISPHFHAVRVESSCSRGLEFYPKTCPGPNGSYLPNCLSQSVR